MAEPIDPAAQREFALDVVERLRAAGHVASWAGGCVRDALLGLVPKDYDVATDARPDQIRTLFGPKRTLAIGAAFGVITVLGKKPAGQIEVATFRQDAAYSDGRHPDAVTFSTPEHDAQRRDFTINGLFFDPLTEQVLDFVGGEKDLQARLIRAIGEPRQRFAEDKLRLLRAVRFAVRYQFAIEPKTRKAIEGMAGQIGVVSVERIAMELRAILEHPRRADGMQLLAELGLLAAIMRKAAVPWPTEGLLSSADWLMTLDVLGALGRPSFPLALAALVHRMFDSGNSSKATSTLCVNLKLSNAETRLATWLVSQYANLHDAPNLPWPQLQRLLVAEEAADLLALAEATARTDDDRAGIDFCRQKLALPPDLLNPPQLITGDVLVEHGLRPSPQFARLLVQVRDAQLLGQIKTKAEALALVDRLRDSGGFVAPNG